MRRVAWFFSIWLFTLGARAEDAEARKLFSGGVQAILARNWTEAVRLLEASLAHKDKAACRFNLIVANHELDRPVEVARHAVAFLATVAGRSHSEEAAEVRGFLSQALEELVILEVTGLPLGAHLKIDDASPRVTDGSRIYELPGPHRLELWLGDHQRESIEIELNAGTVQPWPRVHPIRMPAKFEDSGEQAAPGEDEQQATSLVTGGQTHAPLAQQKLPENLAALSEPTKRGLAWALAATGAVMSLTAFVSYGYVAHRADVLEGWDPDRPGYTNAADQYGRVRAVVMPLAFAGGALMASATTLVAGKPRAARAVSIAGLVAGLVATGLGTTLLVRTPKLLIDDTEITRPSREAGSLFLAAALPLLTYGTRVQWNLWRTPGALAPTSTAP